MKRILLSSALLASLAAAVAPAAHAQNDEWWRHLEQRQIRRDIQRTDRDIEYNRRIAEQERAMGIERPHPTIDTRTQKLPPAPRGYEWQTSANGDSILVVQATGVIVQVVRNVTPPPPVAP